MNKKEYLEKLSEIRVDEKKVDQVIKVYGVDMPMVIKKIISFNDEAVFLDDGIRILSIAEIIDAEKDLQTEFKSKGIIPIADCGENDFIVYHFKDEIWSKFNIVDESVFKKKRTIEELL